MSQDLPLDDLASARPRHDAQGTAARGWWNALPTMSGHLVTLRALRASDAVSLFTLLTADEVSRFMSPPPASIEGFQRFIARSERRRAAGTQACFAIVPRGSETAVGLFQVRALEPAFATAEWGFAMGSDYWGTGMFVEGAQLTAEFAFDVVGVHRLEARAAVRNGRGNGALRKIGAVLEGVLRQSLLRHGEHYDQALWTLLCDDWHETKASCGSGVVLH